MAEFRVVWVIDIDAENPSEAALIARQCQISEDTEALNFLVTDGEGTTTQVQLVNYPEDPKGLH